MSADALSTAFLFSPTALLAFGLILTRISGALLFISLPGATSTPVIAKLTLASILSLLLVQVVPIPRQLPQSLDFFALHCLWEFSLGVAIGTVVGLVNETIAFAMQCLAVQAGYSYASSVDPNSQADTNTLQVLAHLAAGYFFFALGLHHAVFRMLADSFRVWPFASASLDAASAHRLIDFAGAVLKQGLQLALPVVGLLLLTDLTLALLSRVQPQLQLLSLAFPIKSLVALLTLAATFHYFFPAYSTTARLATRTLHSLMPHVAK